MTAFPFAYSRSYSPWEKWNHLGTRETYEGLAGCPFQEILEHTRPCQPPPPCSSGLPSFCDVTITGMQVKDPVTNKVAVPCGLRFSLHNTLDCWLHFSWMDTWNSMASYLGALAWLRKRGCKESFLWVLQSSSREAYKLGKHDRTILCSTSLFTGINTMMLVCASSLLPPYGSKWWNSSGLVASIFTY
jgi:hypothetical protein